MAIINNERYSKYYHKLGQVYERPEVKASLEVIFSVFMVILLIFAAIRPTLTNLAALQKRITDKESLNVKADKKIAQLFKAQEEINNNSQFLILYENAVPDKFSYSDILGRVELYARNNGVEVESLLVPGTKIVGNTKPSGEWTLKQLKPDTEGLVTVPVDFQVSGKPLQIRKFLVEMENIDRLTTIKSVSMNKEVGTLKGSEKIRATGQINFYILDSSK